MFELHWPLLLLALPLPLLMQRWLTPSNTAQSAALIAPTLIRQLGGQSGAVRCNSSRTAAALLWLAWIAVVVAAAQPRWLGEPTLLPTEGRDLLLAVDISGSMEQEDMRFNGQQVNRLLAVKAVVGDFVEQRRGDRLGLVLFGERAYLQSPLTFDRTTLKVLLDEAQIGFAGNGTAIGEAIGLGIKRLRERPASQRVMILLTDGANTSGELDPLRAAELAARAGVKIHTIGIGSDAGERQRILGFVRTRSGSDLDEESLTQIAENTGGRYFRARDINELVEVYRELNRIEAIEQEGESIRPQVALAYWLLAVAALLLALLTLLRAGRTQ